jgi:hypothetical protein
MFSVKEVCLKKTLLAFGSSRARTAASVVGAFLCSAGIHRRLAALLLGSG